MVQPKERESNKTKMRAVISKLVEAGRCSEQDADETLRQYVHFIDNEAIRGSDFRNFCPVTDRIDVLIHSHLSSKNSYSKLWPAVKQLLLLSHGQAAVERGFSTNKNMEADNMKGDTFVAKRLVYDHLRVVGGINNVDTSNKQLLLSCTAARQRYFAHLESEKKQKDDIAKCQKRKAIEDEMDRLKKRRKAVQDDLESLSRSADEFADKAEKEHDLTSIAKSNSLRRAAKEKADEVKTVDQQLDDKLLQLKNC
jgi:hypothetical protein